MSIKRFFRNSADNYKVSYSQCGEDLIVDYVFKLRNVNAPTYLDIGANHPYNLSNTAMFYKRGCSGVNIEANPNLIPAFLKDRPRDINLNIGVGAVNATMDFYLMEDHTLSTFSDLEAKSLMNYGKKILKKMPVEVHDINDVLEKYFSKRSIDFLTIDVEGLDSVILQAMNFSKFSPKIVCAESAEYSPIGAGERRNELIEILQERGYFEYANTNLNAIMVRKDFWFI